MAVLALSVSSCDAVKTVFEVGFWAGVVMVVVVVALVGYLVAKIRRRT